MSELARRVTAEEYLARERLAEFKSELIDGEIVMLASARYAHGQITMNLGSQLEQQLRGRPCQALGSGIRVKAGASQSYFYPDVSVVCGEPEFADGFDDTLLNPSLIAEVLSPSTEALDRGRKWEEYRALRSLRHYLLIAQDHVSVELYTRDQWLFAGFTQVEEVADLTAIGCRLRVGDLYNRVAFGATTSGEPEGDRG